MVRPPCCDKSTVKRGLWTAEEDAKMLAHVAKHGTGNWTSVPKKADPVTHKPFSKILADYGQIGGLLKSGSRTGSLSRDLNNVFTLKPERNPFTPEGISTISSHLMTAPKTEANQECFLSDKHNNGSNQNHSLDLLDQLQAVNLVAEEASSSRTAYDQTIPAPCILDEGSSSSSTCSTAAQEKLPPSFSWCDFLLEDEYLPGDHPQAEQENAAEFSSKNPNAMIPQCVESNVGVDLALPSNSGSDDQVPSPSSQRSSFVEAIIDGESKIFLDFPNLLEEIFHN
ncbi:F14D16.11-RELATED [Salix viminalis]|uniref:F14D16.11-RELATED n=1 Tax=Salix viminalis TaxID=40686 RepID=A0A9Q0SCK3_SALVM|nr:F14D16.11-RELATED [Salix viminalis]